jgi:nucleotide-binding universal stress UspA family protein
MCAAAAVDTGVPGTGLLAPGGEPSRHRIMVAVSGHGELDETLAVAARLCQRANGLLRLVHVREYDPPVPRCPGRFYPETAEEAAAALDPALLIVWGYGLRAAAAVVEAARADVGQAIARQAEAWRADVIVLTRRPTGPITRLLMGSVPDEVMRAARCPVLAVRPRPKVTVLTAGPGGGSTHHGRFTRHAGH